MLCDDPPAFYSESSVVARKPHRCCETGAAIAPGQRYWRCRGKWDGEVRTFAQSPSAYYFCRLYRSTMHECIPFGHTKEELLGVEEGAPIRALWSEVVAHPWRFDSDDEIRQRYDALLAQAKQKGGA